MCKNTDKQKVKKWFGDRGKTVKDIDTKELVEAILDHYKRADGSEINLFD